MHRRLTFPSFLGFEFARVLVVTAIEGIQSGDASPHSKNSSEGDPRGPDAHFDAGRRTARGGDVPRTVGKRQSATGTKAQHRRGPRWRIGQRIWIYLDSN